MEFTKLTKYKTLGSGSYANVYLTDQNTALKVFQSSNYSESEIQEIQHEIDIMKELDHPNLPKFIRSWNEVSGGKNPITFYYLEMTYGGQDLRSYMNQFPQFRVPLDQFTNIMKQILSGLCYLHSHNIVHGDLKLQNILINNGQIMIVDMGISIHTSGLVEQIHAFGFRYGTISTRAPELLLECSDDLFSPAIDIWSLGCVWYALINMIYPFSGDADISHLFNIFNKLGTPTIEEFPELIKCKQNQPQFQRPASELTTNPVYKSIFVYDPKKRITCPDLLQFIITDM